LASVRLQPENGEVDDRPDFEVREGHLASPTDQPAGGRDLSVRS